MRGKIEFRGEKVLLKTKEIAERGYGEEKDEEILLSPYETVYLMEKGVKAIKEGKEVSVEDTYKFFREKDPLFDKKYTVFKDLRNRGYVVKSGFKFGTHFRVYPRGKKPGEAHTEYVVDVFDEADSVQLKDLARMVRLARAIRAKPIIAIVLEGEEVIYYKIERKEM